MTKEEDMERRSGIRLEQHVGVILQVMVVALLGWSLTTTISMSRDVEVLKVQVAGITATMAQGTTDRYRGADAARDLAALRTELRNEIEFLDRRLKPLEERRK